MVSLKSIRLARTVRFTLEWVLFAKLKLWSNPSVLPERIQTTKRSGERLIFRLLFLVTKCYEMYSMKCFSASSALTW